MIEEALVVVVWIVAGVAVLLVLACLVALRRRGPGDRSGEHAAGAAATTRQVHNGPGLVPPST